MRSLRTKQPSFLSLRAHTHSHAPWPTKKCYNGLPLKNPQKLNFSMARGELQLQPSFLAKGEGRDNPYSPHGSSTGPPRWSTPPLPHRSDSAPTDIERIVRTADASTPACMQRKRAARSAGPGGATKHRATQAELVRRSGARVSTGSRAAKQPNAV